MPTDNLDRGDAADRPDPHPGNRDKFRFSDDTGELWLSDGDAWQGPWVAAGGGGVTVLDFTNTGAMPAPGTVEFVSTAGENTIPQVLFGLNDAGSAYRQVAPEVVQPFIVANRETPQLIPPGVWTQLAFDNVVDENILIQNPAFSGNFNIGAQSEPNIIGGLYHVRAKVTLDPTAPSSLNLIQFRAMLNGGTVLLDQTEKRGAGLGLGTNDLLLDLLLPNLLMTGDLTFEVMHDDAQDLTTVGLDTDLRTSVQMVRATQTDRSTLP